MTSGAGAIIYKGFAPTIKMMICISIGFLITRKKMFPPQCAKGVSILSLNVGLPALVFSSMVEAFTPDNIGAFGPLVLIGLLYMVIGAGLAYVIKELFYVPPDFQYGIILMGLLSNWGNLPLAVVQTVAKDSPFDPDTDTELGTAYIAVFVLLMQVGLFPLGLHKLCALDFKEENQERARLPFKQKWRARAAYLREVFRHEKGDDLEDAPDSDSASRTAGRRSPSPTDVVQDETEHERPTGEMNEKRKTSGSDGGDAEAREAPGALQYRTRLVGGSMPIRKVSRAASLSSQLGSTRAIPPTQPLDAADIATSCAPTVPGAPVLPTGAQYANNYSYYQPATPAPSIHKTTLRLRWKRRVLGFLRDFFTTPTSVAICIAIPCSIVLPLKALFVETAGWTGGRMPNAPDGNPPLAFIVDTTEFLGGMSIPATLILLGASFARLEMPHHWRELPINAIVAMTVVKMVLLPVFGIFVIQALRESTSLYPADDKMRQFVSILVAGTPASVNQLVLSQLYNPAGTAHTLSMFLLLQYIAMPILSTALAAIALYIVS